MLNKRTIILLSIFIFLLIFTSRINQIINSVIGGESVAKKTVEGEENFEADPPGSPIDSNHVKNPLTPDAPARYGIFVQKQENLPHNQNQWEQHMKKVLVKSGALNSLEEQKAFDSVQKSPEEYKKRIQIIDERIRNYEKIVQNNPSDEEAQGKLQTLYMLKSTLTVMEKNIVEKVKTK